ncbi:MAG: hypothetical protein P8J45_00965 [Phycisphaerales bacterium]|nr:hypothetical protein [Phycisphaerales bacterium]
MILHAQEEEDRPEDESVQEQAEQQQMLEDFGSGLRAFAATLDDPDIGIDELRALYESAEDALSTDLGMELFLDEHEANQQLDELAEFRDDLKEQVFNGSMSRDEVLATWVEVMDVGFFHKFNDKDDVTWSDRMLDAERTGNLTSIRLRIPDAGDVRTLLRPEFLMRDLKFFGRELELDESTLAVIEVLLEEYVRAYEGRARTLKDAIRTARSRSAKESMINRVTRADDTLERMTATVDWSELRGRIDERIEGEERQAWMQDAMNRFEGAVDGIQQALDRRQRDLEQIQVRPEDTRKVLQLAADLQADRRRMRNQLIEGMMLVLDEGEQEALQGIFEKFILEQARIDSSLGGSRINLELALSEALGEKSMSDRTRETLESATAELLQLVDRWVDARMDRERSGLQLFVAYERDDESALGNLTAGHGQRARTELNAAIMIRDRLMSGQSEIEATLVESDPVTAKRFTELTTSQGFQPQMRTRWCEHALEWAVSCSDLDEEQVATIAEYTSDLDAQLQPIRMKAIQSRLVNEPRIARAKIDKLLARKTSIPMGPGAWREPGADLFLTLNVQVEEQLDSVLAGMDCLKDIPRRRGKVLPAEERAKRAREKAAAEKRERQAQDKDGNSDSRENRR